MNAFHGAVRGCNIVGLKTLVFARSNRVMHFCWATRSAADILFQNEGPNDHSDSDTNPDAKWDSNEDGTPDAKADATPDAKTDATPDAKADAMSDAVSDCWSKNEETAYDSDTISVCLLSSSREEETLPRQIFETRREHDMRVDNDTILP